jgi:hypothetical protein
MSVWWGIFLLGFGALLIVYLAVIEETVEWMEWISPPGVFAVLIMLAGVSLLIRRSRQKAARTP